MKQKFLQNKINKYFSIVTFFLLCFYYSNAQTVNILYNLNATDSTVIGSSRYHASESIYTDAEIGSGNFITAGSAIQKIYFYLYTEGTTTTVSSYKIWMKNIPSATTTFSTGIYNTSGYTLVYNGSFTASPAGLIGITLNTPFTRNSGNNLEVLIERLDRVIHPGYFFLESEGNSSDAHVFSSRKYNGTAAPVSGTTSLTQTVSRPAIVLVHTFPLDAEIYDIVAPTASCFNSPQSIGVQVYNAGLNSIPAGAATITLKVGGANAYSGTLTNPTTIAPGVISTVNFNGINLNNTGDNIDTAYVHFAGDGTTYNDSLSSVFSTATTLSSFPIIEDVESSFLVFPYVNIITGSGQLWSIQSGDYINFDQTSPLSPRLPGNSFFLFDSYSPPSSIGSISRLFSNCILMPSALPPNPSPVTTVSFWMSHDNIYSTSLDSLYLTVSADHGLTWTRLLPGYSRVDETVTAPYWSQEIVNVSAYNGQTVQFGFDGVSQYGNAFGLDDIEINYSGVVPISMLSFEANRNGKINNLTWTTSHEINTNKFIIERSVDGRSFNNIGEVFVTGNNSINNNYQFVDAFPAKGINYYRLRMIDLNSFKYSEVKSVKNNRVAEMFINPNPVYQSMKIEFEAEANEQGELSITDLSGRRMVSQQISVNAGANNFVIPAENISKGSYIVMIRLKNQTFIKKISKL